MADESVDILIQADDQASEVIRKTSDEFIKTQKKAERIFDSTRTEVEKLSAKIKELRQAHRDGAIETDKYREAKQRLQDRIDQLTTSSKAEVAVLKEVEQSTESAQVATDAAGRSFKESAEKAKASTELVGTLATTLGGADFGGVASELAGLTERLSAFSEVSKEGGAGAFAFKAGLLAAAGVISFKVGQAIGNAIFDTARWNLELEQARENFQALSAAAARQADQRFSLELEEIEVFKDPFLQKQAQQDLLDSIQDNLTGVTARVQTARANIKELENAWFLWENTKAQLANDKESLREDEQRLEMLRDQRDQLQFMLSDRKSALDIQRQQNAIEQASRDFLEATRSEIEQLQIQRKVGNAENAVELAEKNVEVARSTTQRTNALRDLAKAEQALAAARDEAIDLELRDSGIAGDSKEEAARLARERDALIEKERKEAEAHRNRLQEIEDRKRAEEQAAKERERQIQQQAREAETARKQAIKDDMRLKELFAKPTELKVVESRILTRGGSRDNSADIAANTKELVEQLKQLNRREEQKDRQPERLIPQPSPTIKVVEYSA